MSMRISPAWMITGCVTLKPPNGGSGVWKMRPLRRSWRSSFATIGTSSSKQMSRTDFKLKPPTLGTPSGVSRTGAAGSKTEYKGLMERPNSGIWLAGSKTKHRGLMKRPDSYPGIWPDGWSAPSTPSSGSAIGTSSWKRMSRTELKLKPPTLGTPLGVSRTGAAGSKTKYRGLMKRPISESVTSWSPSSAPSTNSKPSSADYPSMPTPPCRGMIPQPFGTTSQPFRTRRTAGSTSWNAPVTHTNRTCKPGRPSWNGSAD